MAGVGQAIMGGSGQHFGMSSSDIDTRVSINLEDVVLHEQKLENILQNLRNDENSSLACEDWWDLTETSDIYRLISSKLIKDLQFRQLIIQAQKYETFTIGIV